MLPAHFTSVSFPTSGTQALRAQMGQDLVTGLSSRQLVVAKKSDMLYNEELVRSKCQAT